MSAVTFTPKGALMAERDVIHAVVREIGCSEEWILKGRCQELESRVRQLTGAPEAVALASGTGALTIALAALEIGPGDDVIVPAYCFSAVAAVVCTLGARPVFADCAPGSAVIGAEQVAAVMTPRTRAVIPAHLFTWLAEMPSLHQATRRSGVTLVEDSAVAFGAQHQGRWAGRWGDIGVYSFFPVKPAGGIAEAGMITCDDPDLARRCRWLRNHGQDGITRFRHHLVGYNCRMDEIAAGFLLHRLGQLQGRLKRRAEIVTLYSRELAHRAPWLSLPSTDGETGLNYIYVVRCPDRDDLALHLGRHGVETKTYYSTLLPHQPAFSAFAGDGPWPNASAMAGGHLALPLYPEMSDAQVAYVIDMVASHHG